MITKLQVTNSNFGCSIDGIDWCCDIRFTDNDQYGMMSIVLIKDGEIEVAKQQHAIDDGEWEMKSLVCELLDSVITKSSDVGYWESREGCRHIDAIRDAAEKYIEWMFDGDRLSLDEIE